MKLDDPNMSQSKVEKGMKWIKSICKPEFGLVNSLIYLFIDNMDQPDMVTKTLKILRKLNERVPDLTLKQFQKNKKLPSAIVTYFEINKVKDLSGDAFLMLINVYTDDLLP